MIVSPQDQEIIDSRLANNGAANGAVLRPDIADRLGGKRFNLIDADTSFFPADQRDELIMLYADVFNGVNAVPIKWTTDGAEMLYSERLERPGVRIAAFDRAKAQKVSKRLFRMPIVGAFFANIVPGKNGMRMTHPDMVVKGGEYRGIGLGREINYSGNERAVQICRDVFGKNLAIDEAYTFKNLDFPKNWWIKQGYVVLPLYTQAAREVVERPLTRRGAPKGVKFTYIDRAELPEMAEFMSHPCTVTSDGGPWIHENALAYLEYMHHYSLSTMYAAKYNDKVIALIAADLIPRRSGPSMVDIHYFANPLPTAATWPAIEQVAPAFFQYAVQMANGASMQKYQLPLCEIEIFNGDIEFFKRKNVMPQIHEDTAYVAMRCDHDRLLENSRTPRRITEYTAGPVGMLEPTFT